MKKPPLVEVDWIDARSYYERISWGDVATRCTLAKQHTCGYLVDQNPERTIVAHTFDPCDGNEQPDVVDATVIPTGWIVKLTHIGGKRRLKPKKETPA